VTSSGSSLEARTAAANQLAAPQLPAGAIVLPCLITYLSVCLPAQALAGNPLSVLTSAAPSREQLVADPPGRPSACHKLKVEKRVSSVPPNQPLSLQFSIVRLRDQDELEITFAHLLGGQVMEPN
jgi:hypothetical protein